jgi:hypothetical protein
MFIPTTHDTWMDPKKSLAQNAQGTNLVMGCMQMLSKMVIYFLGHNVEEQLDLQDHQQH